MTAITPEKSVGRIVAENPARARVFEKHRIDYCCGGKLPLQEACQRRAISVHEIIHELAECDRAGNALGESDWMSAPLTELADHIVATHHQYLRQELPRIQALSARVAAVHGDHAPEVLSVLSVFQGLHQEMTEHMMKEEQILFPAIRAMEHSAEAPLAFGGAMSSPIRCMEHEHESAGAAVARLRSLTNGFEPPADACNTWRVLYASLAGIEQDLHTHVHKENNILFPRALELEDRRRCVNA